MDKERVGYIYLYSWGMKDLVLVCFMKKQKFFDSHAGLGVDSTLIWVLYFECMASMIQYVG